MYRHIIIAFLISVIVFFSYFQFGTRWTGKISQELDHYNSLAHAFREYRFDIRNTPVLDELSQFNGKWYPYYGPLPAFFIALLQIASHKIFIPTLYPNAFIGALGVGAMHLVFTLFKKTYFSKGRLSPLLLTFLFAFGTAQFWVSSRSGVWFQVQAYSVLLTTIGLLFLFFKKREAIHYFFSIFFLSLNLFARPHVVLLLTIPLYLYFCEYGIHLRKLLVLFSSTALLFLLFFTYNYLRFDNIMETGLSYQNFHYRFANRYGKAGGWFSIMNVPYNAWFMTLEIPRLTWENGFTQISRIKLESNPEGNSIFFLTPPLVAIFFAQPWKDRDKARKRIATALWVGTLLTMVPIFLLTGTGWQQFGYRYTLDVTPPLLLLVILGMKGRPSAPLYLGIVFSVWMYSLGVMGT